MAKVEADVETDSVEAETDAVEAETDAVEADVESNAVEGQATSKILKKM